MDLPATQTVVVCVKPTPGLRRGAAYVLLGVVHDLIMGPLFVIREWKGDQALPHAYYPWRFEIEK